MPEDFDNACNGLETLSVTDRAYIIHNGEVFRSGRPAELEADAIIYATGYRPSRGVAE